MCHRIILAHGTSGLCARNRMQVLPKGENNAFLEYSIIQGAGTESVGDFNSNCNSGCSDCLSLGTASCHQPQRRLFFR
ncbi:hypothetical protein N9L68_04225 [bacterium]|nr:hypothetical protein [bacterium]